MKAASVTLLVIPNSLVHVHNFFAIASSTPLASREALKNGGAKCHSSVICNGTIPMKDEQNAITRQAAPLSQPCQIHLFFVFSHFLLCYLGFESGHNLV